MSVGHAFMALYSALEILASMDADLSHRLSVVYRRCLRSLDSSSLDRLDPPDLQARFSRVLETLAKHDPEGAFGAEATQAACLTGLDRPAMERLARDIVTLYMDLVLGRPRKGSTNDPRGGSKP